MSSPLMSATTQPWWVQIALNALKSPWVGWVTTTLSAAKILPLPTGTSEVVPIAPDEVVLVPPEPPEPLPDPPSLLLASEPHAASRGTPTPSPTTPPTTARRDAPAGVALTFSVTDP